MYVKQEQCDQSSAKDDGVSFLYGCRSMTGGK
jgi:hypothetical protein